MCFPLIARRSGAQEKLQSKHFIVQCNQVSAVIGRISAACAACSPSLSGIYDGNETQINADALLSSLGTIFFFIPTVVQRNGHICFPAGIKLGH